MAIHREPRRFVRSLIFWTILALCGTLAVTGQEVETPSLSDDIVVEDNAYLEAMSDDQLIGICQERGFGIAEDEGDLTHADFVEAARRCLSMEDEMNAIMAENPDLAAELEAEVLRMKAAKERLEVERNQLLAEKAILEKQLQEAGVDMLAGSGTNATNTGLSQEHPEQLSFEEVMRISLIELFQRVAQDFRFIASALAPILKPAIGGVKMVWRYTRPVLDPFLEQARQKLDPLVQVVKPKAAALYAELKGRVEPFLVANKTAAAAVVA